MGDVFPNTSSSQEFFTKEVKNVNRKLYRQVAKLHGVSVKEVKRAMQAAVDEAYKSPNSYALGIKPTVEDVIAHAVKAAKARI